METLESLRRQIDTATDLSSVVTTMKTLAAVSIHQYEQAVQALREYNRTIELGFQILLRDPSLRIDTDHDGEPKRTAAIVFGSDQGMCGQFNEDIVRLVNAESDARFASLDDPAEDQTPALEGASRNWTILVVGQRAHGQLLDSEWDVSRVYGVPTSVSDISNLVLEMLPHIERLRSEEQVERLLVFYNRRESASSFEPRVVQLLPLSSQQLQAWRKKPWDSRSLPTFASGRRQLLSRLISQHLFVSVFQACAESLASENASRIAAMQAAEKNIEERLEELNSSYNRQRQSAITEEILDVVSGFEALSGNR